MNLIPLVVTDGGRAQAGLRPSSRDCVIRAITLTTGQDYLVVHRELDRRSQQWAATARRTRVHRQREKHLAKGVDNGVYKQVYKPYLAELGFSWTPTMAIGSGTQVHVRRGELPTSGRHILNLSRHLSVLIDGKIHDVFDPSRNGTRAVYGYWSAPEE